MTRSAASSVPVAGRMLGWFAPVAPDCRVAVLRTVLYVFVLLDIHLFVNDPPTLSRDPQLYQPLFFERFLHLPTPSYPLVMVLYVVLWVGCLVGAANRMPRAAGFAVAAAFTWWTAIGMSFGKVDHDHLALVMALWLLPTVGPIAGDTVRAKWTGSERSVQAGWALRCIQIAVIATYFMSALTKLRNDHWVLSAWPESYILTWAIVRRPHGLGQFFLPHPGVLRVMQWFSFLAELTSPIILWLRGRALLAAALFWLGFHVFTTALIYIHFLPTVVCWLAFAPLERLAPWWRRRRPARTTPGQALVEPGGGSAHAGGAAGQVRTVRCDHPVDGRGHWPNGGAAHQFTQHRVGRAAELEPFGERLRAAGQVAVGVHPEHLSLGPLGVVPSAPRSVRCQGTISALTP